MEENRSSGADIAPALLGADTETEPSAPDGFVVLHIAEDGSYDLKVWGAPRTHVLWIDERVPHDRVYEQTMREDDAESLRNLIGPDRIGHYGDGVISAEMAQGIRAMAWRLEGGRLGEVK